MYGKGILRDYLRQNVCSLLLLTYVNVGGTRILVLSRQPCCGYITWNLILALYLETVYLFLRTVNLDNEVYFHIRYLILPENHKDNKNKDNVNQTNHNNKFHAFQYVQKMVFYNQFIKIWKKDRYANYA